MPEHLNGFHWGPNVTPKSVGLGNWYGVERLTVKEELRPDVL